MSDIYVSVAGDTLRKIASKKLGSPFKWSNLLAANPWLNDPARRKAQADIALPDREALFYPGEKFVLPQKSSLIDKSFSGEDKNAYRIILKGAAGSYEITKAIEVSEIVYMNTFVNGFTFTIPWINPDIRLKEILKEDGYNDAYLYIGGKLEYQCVIYNFLRELSDQNGLTCQVWCYSPTADAMDSTISDNKYTYNDISLAGLVKAVMTNPFSIQVDDQIKDITKFKQAQASNTDTVGKFLQNYAQQRQAFINPTFNGNARIWRANIIGKSVGTIREGDNLPTGFSYEYDGRKRFTSFKGICETPVGNLSSIVTDTRVPLTRKTTVKIDSATTEAELKKAVLWHRNRVDAEAKKRVFPVNGLYAPDGNLFTENTIITIISDTMGVPNGFNFIIEGVERKWNANGITTDLHIADPISFSTGEFISL